MFSYLAKYAPVLVANSGVRMRKFMSYVFEDVVKEYRIVMLVKEMDMSMLLYFLQSIKEEKIKDKKIKKGKKMLS